MSKRALLVGINGFAPTDIRSDVPDLKGCVNDAERMARHLKEDFGFAEAETRILRNEKAKGDDVRRELRWLLSDYDEDGSDVRVFHISTHGTQVLVESESDEAVGDDLDEAFVVYDHEWGKPFRDNEIREFFADVPENVAVIFQADCCHSGNISFSISFSPPGADLADDELGGLSGADTLAKMRAAKTKERRDREEIASEPSSDQAAWPDDIDEMSAEPRRLLNPDVFTVHDDLKMKDFRIVGSGARHVLISACEDVQESKEFRTREGFHGGLTWAISKTIEERKAKSRGDATQLTYKELIEEVGNHLRFSEQTPILECSGQWLDTPVFSPTDRGGDDESNGAPQGGQPQMTENEKTSTDQLILFLMTYASAPKKKYGSLQARLQLMRDCGIHPGLIEAMGTRDFDSISQALSQFVKPIGDEGSGDRPITDEGSGS